MTHSWVSGLARNALAILIGAVLLSESMATATLPVQSAYVRPSQGKSSAGSSTTNVHPLQNVESILGKNSQDKTPNVRMRPPIPKEFSLTGRLSDRTRNHLEVVDRYERGGEKRPLGKSQKHQILPQGTKAEKSADFKETAGSEPRTIADYEADLDRYQTTGDRDRIAATLISLGGIYLSLGMDKTDSNETRMALEYFNQALPIYRSRGERLGEANTLKSIGIAYASLRETDNALDCFHQALSIYEELGNSGNSDRYASRMGAAHTQKSIANVYFNAGEIDQALESFQEALQIYRELGDREQEADILKAIAQVYYYLGEKDKAIYHLNRMLAVYRELGDRVKESYALSFIGDFYYYDLGEPRNALDYYERSLQIWHEEGKTDLEAFALNFIGGIYFDLGESRNALNYYQRGLQAYRALDDRRGVAHSLYYLGVVYSKFKLVDKTLDYYQQALQLLQEMGDNRGTAAILQAIGDLYYFSLNQNQIALDYYNQALVVYREAGDEKGEAGTLKSIGHFYYNLHQVQTALDYYHQALPLYRNAGDRDEEADTLSLIGNVYYYDLDRRRTASNYYTQTLPLYRQVGQSDWKADTLFKLASIERKNGNFYMALFYIESAIELIEEIRNKIANEEVLTDYFARKQEIYEFHIHLLMQLHKQYPAEGYDAKALQASERARARMLLESLVEGDADIRQGVDPQWIERERTIEQQLNAKAKRQVELLRGEHTEEEAIAIKEEIELLLKQYREVQAQIRLNSPRYAALTQPKPLTLEEIQQQVLDENTMLLEYYLGSDRSYLWAVTQNSIASYELSDRGEIEEAVRNFRNALSDPVRRNQLDQIKQAADRLQELILKPVAGQLDRDRLLIVSNGALHYIPFAALSVPGISGSEDRYLPLIVEHEVINVPSASALGVLRRETAGRQLASKHLVAIADPVFNPEDVRVNGNPVTEKLSPDKISSESQTITQAIGIGGPLNRLPFTRIEAYKILRLVPKAQRLQALDFDANRDLVTSPTIGQYRIVHFATHGFFNSRDPQLSGLVLSLVDRYGEPQNGFLRMHDIYNLSLPVELVVLSACQTALGEEIRGEGVVGLTRGFMYGGARRIVASLWMVDDEATAQLMARFYKKMLADNLSPAAALRGAQLELWHTERWRSPYYWAGFTYQGEWQ